MRTATATPVVRVKSAIEDTSGICEKSGLSTHDSILNAYKQRRVKIAEF